LLNSIVNWFKRKKHSESFDVAMPNQEVDGKIDIYSPTWKFISVWAIKELQANRESNDKKSLDIVKTSIIRGRISSLKSLLALPDTKK